METINGVWYMKGCRRSDKGCLHSPDDLLELVNGVIRRMKADGSLQRLCEKYRLMP